MKKNLALIIGLAIPVLMIIFVAVSIYLPQVFAEEPKYDFLYVVGDDSWKPLYSVVNQKLVKNDYTEEEKKNFYPKRNENEIKLYVHDVVRNESKQISLETAQTLTLESSNESPDGFEIVPGRREEGIFPFFFFGGSDYRTQYIKKGAYSEKIDIETRGDYYPAFRLLGWIIK